MPIYDDEILRETLVKVENHLDHELKEVVKILRKCFPPDDKYLNFHIQIKGTITGELALSYGFLDNSYGCNPEVTGDTVHMALMEFLRRRGYDANNSSQIIPALLSAPDDREDEEIPF